MKKLSKFVSYDQALAYVNSLSIQEIIEGYANLLWENQNTKPEPIKITESQLKFFKIVGVNENGEPERRGRKRKEA